MKLTSKQIRKLIDQEVADMIQEMDKTVKINRVDRTVEVERPKDGVETVEMSSDKKGEELDSREEVDLSDIEDFKFEEPSYMYSDPAVRDAAFSRELRDYIQKLKDAGVKLSTAGAQNLDRLDPENPNPTDDPDQVGLQTMELTPEEFADLMKGESTIRIKKSDLETIINEVIAESRPVPLSKVNDPRQRIASMLMSGHEKFASVLGIHNLDKIDTFNRDVNEYLSRAAAEIVKMAEAVKSSSD